MPRDTVYLPLERARRRVEAGDVSALGDLAAAHCEALVRDTERVTPILPWASDSPPWSGPHPSQIGEGYGTLYARPGAMPGSWVLHHDREEQHFALTLYDRVKCPAVVEMDGRRWRVRLATDRGPEAA